MKNMKGEFIHFKMLRAVGYVTIGCSFKASDDLHDDILALYSNTVPGCYVQFFRCE